MAFRKIAIHVSIFVFLVEIGARIVKYCSLCEWATILWRLFGGTARICIGLTVIVSFSTFTFNVPFVTR